MPVFFIQSRSLHENQISLTGDLAHHLRDVLRCRPGEVVNLVDEKQTRYRAALSQVTKKQIIAKILQKEAASARPTVSVTLAQAVLKGDKMDWVVQKATELGVNAILPVVSERTIARPRAERKFRQRDRWQKIAKEASQQCGRLDIPPVRPMVSLDELFKNPPDVSLNLLPWEQEQNQSLKAALTAFFPCGPSGRAGDSILVLIGPEGGFTSPEIEEARKTGWVSVSLGPRILRAETAGLAVLAILQYELETRR
ncbi:MAG TPA: 16S rRNA (uracil(1498)-N(3))-methyltransferase [Nitrospiria bacterium]|nr:16S rRNA (uracil(1498)-N(3))-methyltransferase [Nitrospiria bacterium]